MRTHAASVCPNEFAILRLPARSSREGSSSQSLAIDPTFSNSAAHVAQATRQPSLQAKKQYIRSPTQVLQTTSGMDIRAVTKTKGRKSRDAVNLLLGWTKGDAFGMLAFLGNARADEWVGGHMPGTSCGRVRRPV